MKAADPADTAVLVVDEEPGLRARMAEALAVAGHRVSVADDGLRAIACLTQSDFDVVVTDVQLPGANGVEVLRRARVTSPGTEVVMTSAHPSFEVALQCLRAGARDLLQKPFEVADLVASVERAVERRRLHRAGDLYQASQAVMATQELERLPEVIVEVARRVMLADDASLMLPDPSGRLYVAYSSSVVPEVRAAVKGEERVASRIARSREPVLITKGLGSDPRFSDIEDYKRVSSSIVYPLMTGGRLVGVLNLNRADPAEPFRKQDVERAAVLASQALLVLENSRLLRQMVASERLATLGQLAASVAHELNNPASFVLISHDFLYKRLRQMDELAEVLSAEPESSAAGKAWRKLGGAVNYTDLLQATEDLADGVRRIRDIVFDLRGLSRTEDSPTRVDLNDAIRSSLRVAAAELRGKPVSLDLGADLFIVGSTGRLSQVFLNLLMNAAQAVGERTGGPDAGPGEIRVTTRRAGERVVAEIFNNGPAIAPEHLPRIFEPFFTTKSAGVGTGLGLSTSRDIVHRHQGEILVESSSERGTRFTIWLPAVAPAARHTGATSGQAIGPATGGGNGPAAPIPRSSRAEDDPSDLDRMT
jgi:two-component system NtrC family sensor kinase